MRGALCSGVAVVVLLAAAGDAAAQWAWKDKDGKITASDRPPPKDIPDKDILRRPAQRAIVNTAAAAPAAASAASATAAGPKSPLEAQVEAKKKAAEQEQAAKAKAEEEKAAVQRAENCRRARGQLATLESGVRMARTNDKGEREVLDDAARAAETQRARQIIASDCR